MFRSRSIDHKIHLDLSQSASAFSATASSSRFIFSSHSFDVEHLDFAEKSVDDETENVSFAINFVSRSNLFCSSCFQSSVKIQISLLKYFNSTRLSLMMIQMSQS